MTQLLPERAKCGRRNALFSVTSSLWPSDHTPRDVLLSGHILFSCRLVGGSNIPTTYVCTRARHSRALLINATPERGFALAGLAKPRASVTPRFVRSPTQPSRSLRFGWRGRGGGGFQWRATHIEAPHSKPPVPPFVPSQCHCVYACVCIVPWTVARSTHTHTQEGRWG